MGIKNYLVEGVSGTGKSSICKELRKRGFRAVDGDNELAYQGDPITGEPTQGSFHKNHIWNVAKVKKLIANKDDEVTFFCGGSRNFDNFIDLFDEVFILDIDVKTLNQRLNSRPDNAWGKKKSERYLILKLNKTKKDIPRNGIIIDATQPIERVAEEIIKHAVV